METLTKQVNAKIGEIINPPKLQLPAVVKTPAPQTIDGTATIVPAKPIKMPAPAPRLPSVPCLPKLPDVKAIALQPTVRSAPRPISRSLSIVDQPSLIRSENRSNPINFDLINPLADLGEDLIGCFLGLGVIYESLINFLSDPLALFKKPETIKAMPLAIYAVPAKLGNMIYDRLATEQIGAVPVGYVGEGEAKEFQFSVPIRVYKITEDVLNSMKVQYRRIK